jgi:hypothetical protein
MTKTAFHSHIDGAIALIYGAPRLPRGEPFGAVLVADIGVLDDP